MTKYILDTNLYISFFTKRDLDQYKTACNYISKMVSNQIVIYLPDLIIAEIVYILSDYYAFNKVEIVRALLALLSEESLKSDSKEIMFSALNYFEQNNFDFADCYLLALKEQLNSELITFDKKLKNKAEIDTESV